MNAGLVRLLRLPADGLGAGERVWNIVTSAIERNADIVEERTQILTEQHHADSGNDGDERDQERVLGGDGAGFVFAQAKRQ